MKPELRTNFDLRPHLRPRFTHFDVLEADIPACGVDQAHFNAGCSNINPHNVGGQLHAGGLQYFQMQCRTEHFKENDLFEQNYMFNLRSRQCCVFCSSYWRFSIWLLFHSPMFQSLISFVYFAVASAKQVYRVCWHKMRLSLWETYH